MRQLIISHSENGTQIEPEKRKKWTIEILEGLEYLHGKQVVHLDIKPENILLEELQRIKIADVGMARNIMSISSAITRGTPCYFSPQLIDGLNINEKADIW
jgi:serine/threonine protein kinase